MPIVPESQLARGLLHFVLAPGEFFPSDGDQLFRSVGDHLGGQLDHQAFASDRVTDDVAGIAGARGARAAAPNIRSPDNEVTAAAGATSPAAAAASSSAATRPATRSRFSYRRSAIRASQARHSFAQEVGVGGERLVHRFVWLIDPPGEERVVAVVITEPRPQRVSQAVDRRRRSIADRSLDPALFTAQP